MQNLLKALGPQTQVILVAHGPGLALLTRSGTTEAERIRSLLGAKVVFAACRNTMRRKNVNPADLLEGVITVDSGVAEVVRRQHAGWAYIKSGH